MSTISVTEYIHSTLQMSGYRYCPVNEEKDSTTFPPQENPSCGKKFQHGYNIFLDDGNVCIMYHTRCRCAHKYGWYTEKAQKFLEKWISTLQEHPVFSKMSIKTTQKGQPYIDTGTSNKQIEVHGLHLFTDPYMEVTLTSI